MTKIYHGDVEGQPQRLWAKGHALNASLSLPPAWVFNFLACVVFQVWLRINAILYSFLFVFF